MANQSLQKAYWNKNKRIVGFLLFIWAVASFGCGILFSDYLDQFSIGGFTLGFWFAQQGSMYIFVALIVVYTFWMKKLDRNYKEREAQADGR